MLVCRARVTPCSSRGAAVARTHQWVCAVCASWRGPCSSRRREERPPHLWLWSGQRRTAACAWPPTGSHAVSSKTSWQGPVSPRPPGLLSRLPFLDVCLSIWQCSINLCLQTPPTPFDARTLLKMPWRVRLMMANCLNVPHLSMAIMLPAENELHWNRKLHGVPMLLTCTTWRANASYTTRLDGALCCWRKRPRGWRRDWGHTPQLEIHFHLLLLICLSNFQTTSGFDFSI